VHKSEELFNELAAASPDARAAHFAQLKTSQQAWQALFEERYGEAMRLFQEVVRQTPDTPFAALARYQMGNINFEHFRNYKDAALDYDLCLKYPPQFLPESALAQVHERIEEITQNMVDDDYAPLRIFYEAESSKKPAAAIDLYLTLLKQYPQSTKVPAAIEAATRTARQTADDDQLVRQVLNAFVRFQEQNPDDPYEMYAQLGAADMVNYCIRNHEQAFLEYSEIMKKTKDPKMIQAVQERLRQLRAH
jgi:outer membrane protein assembly factor BamD (BamD/ComL family)